MRYRRVVASALLLTLSVASHPPGEEYVPEFIASANWFHGASTPVGNLDAHDGEYVGWSTAAPTSPVSSLYLMDNVVGSLRYEHDPEHFFHAVGTFTGDIDTIAFDVYAHNWAQNTLGCSVSLSFDFRIDGTQILYQSYQGSDGITYTVIDDTRAKLTFALTNIWEAIELYDLPVGHDLERTYEINIQNFYLCNEFVFAYDGVDDPSAITFNREKLGGYFKIDVLDPPPPIASETA